MRLTPQLTTTTALVALLAATPLYAQSTDSSTDTQTQSSQSETNTNSSGNASNTTASGANSSAQTGNGDSATPDAGGAGSDENMVIVTVGDTEILGSDVSAAISMLPPQLRQQPPEMLVPMAVNQLISRELILREAMAENLKHDPEVVALVTEAQNASEEDAMVQIWLQRKLDESVTDQKVQQMYDEIKANTDQEIPPLEDVRVQIEQQLRQDAFTTLQEDLRSDVEIVFYGPDGKPQTASSD
jgi:hypothetical protein